jgi:hypothetical protein
MVALARLSGERYSAIGAWRSFGSRLSLRAVARRDKKLAITDALEEPDRAGAARSDLSPGAFRPARLRDSVVLFPKSRLE